jgi:YidC/Oxa1 family membrane protein insertase
MDKRLLLAVVLSVLVVIAYQEYLRIYFPEIKKPAAPPAETTPRATGTAPIDAAPPPPVQATREDGTPRPALTADVSVETDLWQIGISSVGGSLVSMKLKEYRATVDPKSPPLDLVAAAGGHPPLALRFHGERIWSDEDVRYEPSATSLVLAGSDRGELVLRGEHPDLGPIEKRLRFEGSSYLLSIGVSAPRAAEAAREVAVLWSHSRFAPAHRGEHYRGVEALVGRKLLYLAPTDLEKGIVAPDPQVAGAGPVFWGGYADSYFLSALIPQKPEQARFWTKLEGDVVVSELLLPARSVEAEREPFVLYAGPKSLDHLKPAGHNLVRALDLGWFSFVAEPMLRVLKLFHGVTGNYGWDIILLTVMIKVLFIPLTQKSYKSMQELQKLQPQMKKLQEKYKDDRAALNREVMELYRRHKVNPLGGCLPMLLQMPVFIGLYNALFYAVELRHAPFALWINDLSAPDRLPPFPHPPLANVAGIDVRIPVLTLLMGVSMIVQTRMTPASGDPTQQRMMMFMPVVFTVMFVSFPAGLVLYWFVNNVLTVVQQTMVQRAAQAKKS